MSLDEVNSQRLSEDASRRADHATFFERAKKRPKMGANTQRKVQGAINEYTDFIITSARHGSILGVDLSLSVESVRNVRNTLVETYMYTIKLCPRSISFLQDEKKRRYYEARTVHFPAVPMPINQTHRYAKIALSEGNDYKKFEPSLEERTLYARGTKFSEVRADLMDLLWNYRLSLLCEDEVYGSMFELTDHVHKMNDKADLVDLLVEELSLWRYFSCSQRSPRYNIYGVLDLQSFSDSTMRCLRMYLNDEMKVPKIFLDAFSQGAKGRKLLLKEIAEWDEAYGNVITNRFTLPMPADLFDDFLLHLICCGDNDSLFCAFGCLTIYNLLCRIEVPNKMKLEQIFVQSFTPVEGKDKYYFNINSAAEKNSGMRNYTRAVYLDGNSPQRNIMLPLALILMKKHQQGIRKISPRSWTMKVRDYFCAAPFSQVFRRKLDEFYETFLSYPGKACVESNVSSREFCEKKWGPSGKITGYCVRKMATDHAMDTFLNISENIVRSRGRWFGGIAQLVREIKQYEDSFRKYNLHTTSEQDHQIGRHQAGKYCRDRQPHYALATFDKLCNEESRWSNFLPAFPVGLKHYERLVRVTLAQALVQLPDVVFTRNWNLHSLKSTMIGFKCLREDTLFNKPERPVPGESLTDAQINFGTCAYRLVNEKIVSSEYVRHNKVIKDYASLRRDFIKYSEYGGRFTASDQKTRELSFLHQVGIQRKGEKFVMIDKVACEKFTKELKNSGLTFYDTVVRKFICGTSSYPPLKNLYHLLYNVSTNAARKLKKNEEEGDVASSRAGECAQKSFECFKNQIYNACRTVQVILSISPNYAISQNSESLNLLLDVFCSEAGIAKPSTNKLFLALKRQGKLATHEEMGFRNYQDTLDFLLEEEEDDGIESMTRLIQEVSRIKKKHWLEIHGLNKAKDKLVFDAHFPTDESVLKLLLKIYKENRHLERFQLSMHSQMLMLKGVKGRAVKTACDKIRQDPNIPKDLLKLY